MSLEKRFLLIGGETERETIRRAMTAEGYAVRHIASGGDGLKAAAEFAPDVIALDALAVCQQLRQNPKHLETPILWLATAAEDAQTEAALLAGANELLRKPVDGLEIRVRIRSMVQTHQNRVHLRGSQHFRQDFMDQLVHDIRSPLQVILGFSELLCESTEMAANEHSQVRSIRGAASHLESLADNLIVSTHLETGDLLPRSQPTAPMELAQRITDSMRPIAALRRITLALDANATAETLDADCDLVGRALRIFLDNAIRISPSGRIVQIRVRTGNPAGVIAFEVADQGLAVPEVEREVIFDLPRLLELRRSGHARQGRGMGLNLCRLVADAHRGRVRVESNPEGGSIFILELPSSAA